LSSLPLLNRCRTSLDQDKRPTSLFQPPMWQNNSSAF
jgi:hypothetical protein